MRASHRLHKTLKAYFKVMEEERCFSCNGEYSKKVETKLRSIHKQLERLIDKEKGGEG